MTHNNQIEIPLSKRKLFFTFFASIIFVGIGTWFVINPPKINNTIFGNPTFLFIVGLASILFFGFAAATIFRKLCDKKAGFIVNQQGIVDNSSGVSAGIILWTDIEEIKTSKVMSQKFIMIIVKNPQDYLKKVTNPLKRKTMEMNYKTYGSPISISANSLQISFDNLYKLLTENVKKYKS